MFFWRLSLICDFIVSGNGILGKLTKQAQQSLSVDVLILAFYPFTPKLEKYILPTF